MALSARRPRWAGATGWDLAGCCGLLAVTFGFGLCRFGQAAVWRRRRHDLAGDARATGSAGGAFELGLAGLQVGRWLAGGGALFGIGRRFLPGLAFDGPRLARVQRWGVRGALVGDVRLVGVLGRLGGSWLLLAGLGGAWAIAGRLLGAGTVAWWLFWLVGHGSSGFQAGVRP